MRKIIYKCGSVLYNCGSYLYSLCFEKPQDLFIITGDLSRYQHDTNNDINIYSEPIAGHIANNIPIYTLDDSTLEQSPDERNPNNIDLSNFLEETREDYNFGNLNFMPTIDKDIRYMIRNEAKNISAPYALESNLPFSLELQYKISELSPKSILPTEDLMVSPEKNLTSSLAETLMSSPEVTVTVEAESSVSPLAENNHEPFTDH